MNTEDLIGLVLAVAVLASGWTNYLPVYGLPCGVPLPETRRPPSKPSTSSSISAQSESRPPGGEVRLTPTEWHIVEVLVRNPASS
jgi:hypothetical protein